MHGNWNNDMHDGLGWGWIPMTIMMMLLAFGSLIWLGASPAARSNPTITAPASKRSPRHVPDLDQLATAGRSACVTSGRNGVPVSQPANRRRTGTTVNHPTAATMPPSARPATASPG